MIPIQSLDSAEVQLVRRCLEASVAGPFFPDWEFESLFGLTRARVAAIANGWPQNAADTDAQIAVMNALTHLSGYPHGQEEELRRIVTNDAENLRRLLNKLQALPNDRQH